MINSSNILEYITFLYLRKYQTNAPQDVLDSWSSLSNEDLKIYLPELYAHWNLNPAEIKVYEEDFLNKSNPLGSTRRGNPPVFPKMQSSLLQEEMASAHSIPTVSKKRNNFLKVFLIILFFLMMSAIAYLAYNLMYQPENPLPEVVAPTEKNKPIPNATEIPQEEIEMQTDNISSSDYENIMNLKILFKAEEDRDLNGILNVFSPQMEQYWDINYPTTEELASAYEHTWEITKSNKNTNIQINKTSENTYDVKLNYSYISLTTNKQKSVTSKIRFIFDDNHKIIKSYGLK